MIGYMSENVLKIDFRGPEDGMMIFIEKNVELC
jgi:hypothetical protein